MKQVVLRRFFDGHATATELAADLEGTRLGEEPPGCHSSVNYRIEPMADAFEVTPAHIVRIVDAVVSGQLSLEALDILVFCIEARDEWRWDTNNADGEHIANALFWLGTPEINFALTRTVLAKIRHYLLTGDDTLQARR